MDDDLSRYYAPPALPQDRVCEWCDEPSTAAFTIVYGKSYVYTCARHLSLAEQAVTGRRVDRPRRSRRQDDALFDPRGFEDAA